MAYHTQETEGVLFTASYQIGDDLYDAKYPVGALALATVAVSIGLWVSDTTRFPDMQNRGICTPDKRI